MTQGEYQKVIEAWSMLVAFSQATAKNPTMPASPGLAISYAETVSSNETDPAQKASADSVYNILNNNLSTSSTLALQLVWAQVGAIANRGYLGAIDYQKKLPLVSMQSRLSKVRYAFKMPSSTEQKSGEPVDETQPPVAEESTFPGWVIPVVAGVMVIGGVYWYMNRGV